MFKSTSTGGRLFARQRIALLRYDLQAEL